MKKRVFSILTMMLLSLFIFSNKINVDASSGSDYWEYTYYKEDFLVRENDFASLIFEDANYYIFSEADEIEFFYDGSKYIFSYDYSLAHIEDFDETIVLGSGIKVSYYNNLDFLNGNLQYVNNEIIIDFLEDVFQFVYYEEYIEGVLSFAYMHIRFDFESRDPEESFEKFEYFTFRKLDPEAALYTNVTVQAGNIAGPLQNGQINVGLLNMNLDYSLLKEFEDSIKNVSMKVYPPGEMSEYEDNELTIKPGSTNKITLEGSTTDIGFDILSDGTGILYYFNTSAINEGSLVVINFDIKVVYDDEAPVINGETNYIVNVDNPVTEATIKSGLFAIDNVDGHIPSSAFVLVSDGYTANKTTVGIYEIKYTVSDAAGNVSAVTVKVHVKDVVKPTISGTSSYTIAYNQTQSLTTVLNNLTASDNYDTSLTIQLVSDDYTSNKTTLGTYDVKYQVTDSSGNKSDVFTVKITVVDTVKPTITGPNTFTAVYNAKKTIDSIKSELTANDGYDGNISNNITVKSDGYSSKYNIKGSYTIVFEVKDSSNNAATFNVTVNVIDNIKPTISGTNTYNVGSTANLTEATIRAGLTANDDYDGPLTLVLVEDNYSRNPNIIKSHTLKYKATDSSGNTQEFTVTVNVYDDIPPQIFTNDTFINVDGSLNMTVEEIIEHLIKVGSIEANVNLDNYFIASSDYDSTTPGFYEVVMGRKLSADINLKETYSIGIRVFEAPAVPGPIFTPDQTITTNWPLIIGLSVLAVVLIGSVLVIFSRKKRK